MRELQEISAIMRALLEISSDDWVATFEKSGITLNHKKFGNFTFANIYEVKDFMHDNFIVIGHQLFYNK